MNTDILNTYYCITHKQNLRWKVSNSNHGVRSQHHQLPSKHFELSKQTSCLGMRRSDFEAIRVSNPAARSYHPELHHDTVTTAYVVYWTMQVQSSDRWRRLVNMPVSMSVASQCQCRKGDRPGAESEKLHFRRGGGAR